MTESCGRETQQQQPPAAAPAAQQQQQQQQPQQTVNYVRVAGTPSNFQNLTAVQIIGNGTSGEQLQLFQTTGSDPSQRQIYAIIDPNSATGQQLAMLTSSNTAVAVPLAGNIDNSVIQNSITSAATTAAPSPVVAGPPVDNDEPLYVNAKQYHRIMKRRQQRARLEALGKIPKSRPKYLHESRHRHALRRSRNNGGRFLAGAPGKEDEEGSPEKMDGKERTLSVEGIQQISAIMTSQFSSQSSIANTVTQSIVQAMNHTPGSGGGAGTGGDQTGVRHLQAINNIQTIPTTQIMGIRAAGGGKVNHMIQHAGTGNLIHLEPVNGQQMFRQNQNDRYGSAGQQAPTQQIYQYVAASTENTTTSQPLVISNAKLVQRQDDPVFAHKGVKQYGSKEMNKTIPAGRLGWEDYGR